MKHWQQLFEIAGLCLNDERYCELLTTPWAYTVEASIVAVCILVAGFAYLAGKISKLIEESENESKR
mgnify:CR=1 FL=1